MATILYGLDTSIHVRLQQGQDHSTLPPIPSQTISEPCSNKGGYAERNDNNMRGLNIGFNPLVEEAGPTRRCIIPLQQHHPSPTRPYVHSSHSYSHPHHQGHFSKLTPSHISCYLRQLSFSLSSSSSSSTTHLRSFRKIWNQSVTVLFFFCLLLLLRALGGFGHTETSCGICAMERSSMNSIAGEGFIELNGSVFDRYIGKALDYEETLVETLVDWEEPDPEEDPYEQSSKQEATQKKLLGDFAQHFPPASHHLSHSGDDVLRPAQNSDSELSFFLKHFNDRYTFTPLDATNEMYGDDEPEDRSIL